MTKNLLSVIARVFDIYTFNDILTAYYLSFVGKDIFPFLFVYFYRPNVLLVIECYFFSNYEVVCIYISSVFCFSTKFSCEYTNAPSYSCLSYCNTF